MNHDKNIVDLYWRPGCPFCSMLERGLAKQHIAYRKLNIWDDPAHAAFVRSVAKGNETVPTVSLSGESLVNPSATQVKQLIERHSNV